ncbi:hypothetical protein OOK31_08285 [Streptomyces sp. NBC_00249]|uniref:hypothetical protein n=1 Tax=Streptomyces sp. NBC_00249 TaxID=2975690 RepID=UPI002250493F|nr:hypothetical protein [Streptomyces sp. NBC_00249]MCX5193892.1 hypothetical protein [Streptomyces sp. NBC_00249]
MRANERWASAPPPARQRRLGCLGVVVAPLVVVPLALAARIHRPVRPDRLVDPAIERAQIARTSIGVLATLWLVYAYPLRESAGAVVEGKIVEMVMSAGMLLVLGPIALTGFVLSARRPGPAFYRARLRGPLTALGALFGTALLLWASVQFGPELLGPAAGLVTLVLLPFAIASAVLCVHHTFRTADVHEVLPPLISPVLVWSMCAVQLFDAPPVTAPPVVRLLFLAGPPLSVTALSMWELRRLRVRYGITVRVALGRPPRRTP